MFNRGVVGCLLLIGLLLAASSVIGSQCVTCHTDVEKLKLLAKSIPIAVSSTQTAGKG